MARYPSSPQFSRAEFRQARMKPSGDDVDWAFSTRKIDARLIDACDRDLYRALYMDRYVMRHIGPTLRSDEVDTMFWKVLRWNSEVPMRARYWCLSEKQHGVSVGMSALVQHSGGYEIGLMILPEWQGTGLGLLVTRSIRDMSMMGRWGDRIQTLTLQPRIGNVASRGLCEKLGFRLIDEDDQRVFWRLTRNEWRQNHYE